MACGSVFSRRQGLARPQICLRGFGAGLDVGPRLCLAAVSLFCVVEMMQVWKPSLFETSGVVWNWERNSAVESWQRGCELRFVDRPTGIEAWNRR